MHGQRIRTPVGLILTVTFCVALLGSSNTSAQEAEAGNSALFAEIAERAEARANQAYQPPATVSSDVLNNLTYDDYRKILFRRDRALWRGEALFEAQLAHPGFLYDTPVILHLVEDGQAQELAFDKSRFEYLDPELGKQIPDDTRYAGFKLLYPLNKPDKWDEVAVFLGASYFRLLGRDQVYGISARGLAVDTATSRGEEFPSFREFWLVKPDAEATSMVVYALLDSPSVSGAYRFHIYPGDPTTVDVKARLFMRSGGRKLGLAPMTSMFLYGENRLRHFDDFRPEVHDSDGLLVQTGRDGWIWRPLNNPPELRVTSLSDENPRGFGLMQRDRAFDHYLDLEAQYERRPSLWVSPKGDWGKGRVELVEIPSNEEVNDNIVAYWVPEPLPQAGERVDLEYRIEAGTGPALPRDLGHVTRTRVGWAGIPGSENNPPRQQRRFIVEFAGDALAKLSPEQPVKAELTASAGRISDVDTRKIPKTGAWRTSFHLAPENGAVSDMQLFLELRNQQLTETWNYVYSPGQLD